MILLDQMIRFFGHYYIETYILHTVVMLDQSFGLIRYTKGCEEGVWRGVGQAVTVDD